jgi:hypothetical protein
MNTYGILFVARPLVDKFGEEYTFDQIAMNCITTFLGQGKIQRDIIDLVTTSKIQ